MKGSSLIPSCAFVSFSTILSSHFQLGRRFRPKSWRTIRIPEDGVHLLSNGYSTQLSDGDSGAGGEPAYIIDDQDRSYENGAHRILNNSGIPARIERTPAWMKARLNLTAQCRLRSHTSYGNRDCSQDEPGNGSMRLPRAGTNTKALAILKNHLRRGITVDVYMYADVLRRCSKQKDLLTAKQVHDCIIQSGMIKNSYVACNLLNVYIKCGQLLDARQVFDEVEKKDVVTWNMMITGYANNDNAESALELYKSMSQEGVQPNDVTYLCILKACASPSALEWGKDLHLGIRNTAFESDVRVATALLQMYVKCGCLTEARQVFNTMERRNLITWNTMIGGLAQNGCGHESYRLFLRMRREGLKPNAITFFSILNPSAGVGALEWVKEVHAHAKKVGLESDLRVASALVHMYAKSGSLDDARVLFDRMEKRDLVTWNVMIGGLALHGSGHEAYRLFVQMRREGFEPDAFTFVNILNASASTGALVWVKQVHDQASKAGMVSDLRVGNRLIHMYAQSGSIYNAQLVFDRMETRDVVSWNVLISAVAQDGRGHEAYKLYLRMKREGFEPDAYTFASIFNACSSAGALEWVKEVHGHARIAGLEPDSRVGNALVHMYSESGSIDEAQLVFDRMENRDVVTWNTMLNGLAHHGSAQEALTLFKKMNADLLKPDGTTFVAVLAACCHGGFVDEGRRLFSAMTQYHGIEPDIVHYTCMVDLLGRAGHLEEAKWFILNMPLEPDAVTWRALLGACRTYGNVELGEFAAKALFNLDPNIAAGYVALSNIYAAAGKWEKVSLLRTTMQQLGIRKEPGRSWIEVDNKVHEFIVGDTCHPEAEAIYTYLRMLSEKLRTEGYIPDTRLVLHNIGEEEKELALCSHSEKLAIAYGLMRIPPGRPIRVFKNLRVCADCHTATKLISKMTGREIIARDAIRFHHFKNGICSCGDYW